MNIQKKAKKFLKFLAMELPKGLSMQVLGEVFAENVEAVPDSVLREELVNNMEHYVLILSRYLSNNTEKEATVVEETARTDKITTVEYPFNLFLNLDENQDDAADASVYKCLFAVKQDEKLLAKIGDFKDLCNATIASEGPIKATMLLFNKKVSETVDEVLASGDLARLKQTQEDILKSVVYFHMKREEEANRTSGGNALSDFQYEDVMAALLSLYGDLTCVAARNRGDSDGDQVGKKFVLLIKYLLQSSPQHIMDVFIQMTQIADVDESLILPLYRSLIEHPPFSLGDCKTYTKYVIMVKQVTAKLGGDEVDRLKKIALGTKAPKKYLHWLKEENEELVNDLPDNASSFKGVNITKFLLEEASEETMEGLLNLLTVDMSALAEDGQTVDDEEAGDDDVETQAESLFFIDTSNGKANSQEIDEEDNADDEIVIDEDMLDKELAAMDDDEMDQIDDMDHESDDDTSDSKETETALDEIESDDGSEEISVDEEGSEGGIEILSEEDEEKKDEEKEEEVIVVESVKEVCKASPHKSRKVSALNKFTPERKIKICAVSPMKSETSEICVVESSPVKLPAAVISKAKEVICVDEASSKPAEVQKETSEAAPTVIQINELHEAQMSPRRSRRVSSRESDGTSPQKPILPSHEKTVDDSPKTTPAKSKANRRSSETSGGDSSGRRRSRSEQSSDDLHERIDADQTAEFTQLRTPMEITKDAQGNESSLCPIIQDVESENKTSEAATSISKSRIEVLKEENSVKLSSPRRSRRSLATPSKPPLEILPEDSPLNDSKVENMEVFDLSSILDSPQNAGTPRRRSLRKSVLSKQLPEPTSEQQNNEPGLSLEEIQSLSSKRPARTRNNSGLSGMSEDSVSSNTRSRSKALGAPNNGEAEEPATPTRNTRRKSMPASAVKNVEPNVSDSPAGGRATRRRTLQASDFPASPITKKPKVLPAENNSPRTPRSKKVQDT